MGVQQRFDERVDGESLTVFPSNSNLAPTVCPEGDDGHNVGKKRGKTMKRDVRFHVHEKILENNAIHWI